MGLRQRRCFGRYWPTTHARHHNRSNSDQTLFGFGNVPTRVRSETAKQGYENKLGTPRYPIGRSPQTRLATHAGFSICRFTDCICCHCMSPSKSIAPAFPGVMNLLFLFVCKHVHRQFPPHHAACHDCPRAMSGGATLTTPTLGIFWHEPYRIDDPVLNMFEIGNVI